ncbi:hypothetical protein [Mesorhizobium sp. M0139]|uniref:hypothetical protein n=1 Tax=Mesorhizobium sp. M0139 TaxID=2956892 RepID=UPI0033376BC1
MPDSSTDLAVEDAITAPDVTSEPSTETQNQGVGSLLDAVNTALGEEKPEAAPASVEPGSKEPVPNPSEPAPEISEQEIKTYGPGAQRRIRELVEANRTAKSEAEPLRQELEAVKPKAAQMDQMLDYMRENNVAPEHLDNALGLTALINRGDYDRALPILENLLTQVRSAAGETLPADLQKKVELGYITEHDAKALHKAQTTVQRTTEQAAQDKAKSESERQQRETQTMVHTAVSAAEAWNQEQATTDPEWNLKRELVTQRMELELLRLGPQGYPRTQAAVRTLLADVKKEVEKGISRFKAPPKAISPSPTGGSALPRSKTQPKSLMDAVNVALGE